MRHSARFVLAALLAAVSSCSREDAARAERSLDRLGRALDGEDVSQVLDRLPADATGEPRRLLEALADGAGVDLGGGTWRVLGDVRDAFPANPVVRDWLARGRRDPTATLGRALDALPTDAPALRALREAVASIEPLRRAVDRAAEGGTARDADAIARRLERLARDAGRFEVADSKGALRSLDVVRIDDAWLPEDLAKAWLDALERTRDRVGRLDPTDVRRLAPVLDRLERETGALLGTPSEAALRARLEEILGL